MDREFMFEAFGDIDEAYVQEATRAPWNLARILTIAAATAAAVALIIGLITLNIFDQRGYLFDKSSGDGWKLIMPSYGKNSQASGSDSQELPNIRFDSLSEMRNDILTGDFTENELNEFARASAFSMDIRCPDLDNLYVPVCPDGIAMAGPVTWYFGSSYSLSMNFDADHYSDIVVTICSKSLLHTKYDLYAEFVNGKDGINPITILESAYDAERNAMEYHYLSHTDNELKSVFYCIQQGDKEILVREDYYSPDDTVPYHTDIAMRDGDGYAWLTVGKTDERLTLEFITSFGLEKFN